jgi:hypothetical protein
MWEWYRRREEEGRRRQVVREVGAAVLLESKGDV